MRIRPVLSSAKQAVSVLFYLALESDCLGKALNVREQLVGLISSLSLRNSLSLLPLSLSLFYTNCMGARYEEPTSSTSFRRRVLALQGWGKKERQIEQERKQLPT